MTEENRNLNEEELEQVNDIAGGEKSPKYSARDMFLREFPGLIHYLRIKK